MSFVTDKKFGRSEVHYFASAEDNLSDESMTELKVKLTTKTGKGIFYEVKYFL